MIKQGILAMRLLVFAGFLYALGLSLYRYLLHYSLDIYPTSMDKMDAALLGGAFIILIWFVFFPRLVFIYPEYWAEYDAKKAARKETIILDSYTSDVIRPKDSRAEILKSYSGNLSDKIIHTIVNALVTSLTAYETSNYVFDERGNPSLDKVTKARKETKEAALKMLHFLDVSLPSLHHEGPFQISLLDTINNFGFFLERFLEPLFQVQSPGLFDDIKSAYYRNQNALAIQVMKKEHLEIGSVLAPRQHPGTPQEIIRIYLTGTPFRNLFDG